MKPAKAALSLNKMRWKIVKAESRRDGTGVATIGVGTGDEP